MLRPKVRYKDVRFRDSNPTVSGCDFEGKSVVGPNTRLYGCKIGRHSYFGGECIFSNVVVGRFCSIGPSVFAGLGRHPTTNVASTHPAFFSAENWGCYETFVTTSTFVEMLPVRIGHDVWIGAKTFIQDGVSIGHGAIIGAGAVVTHDVPPYAIVVGVPAKIIRFRASTEQIARLLQIAWWEWSDDILREHATRFNDLGTFIAHFSKEQL